MASVASFFISRIDTLIDGQLAARIKTAKTPEEQATLRGLQGKVAIANGEADLPALQANFQRAALEGAGGSRRADAARALGQHEHEESRVSGTRTTWKNLIGPDTVDTIPPATYDAFRDHGHPRPSLEEGIDARAGNDGDAGACGNFDEGRHGPAHATTA